MSVYKTYFSAVDDFAFSSLFLNLYSGLFLDLSLKRVHCLSSHRQFSLLNWVERRRLHRQASLQWHHHRLRSRRPAPFATVLRRPRRRMQFLLEKTKKKFNKSTRFRNLLKLNKSVKGKQRSKQKKIHRKKWPVRTASLEARTRSFWEKERVRKRKEELWLPGDDWFNPWSSNRPAEWAVCARRALLLRHLPSRKRTRFARPWWSLRPWRPRTRTKRPRRKKSTKFFPRNRQRRWRRLAIRSRLKRSRRSLHETPLDKKTAARFALVYGLSFRARQQASTVFRAPPEQGRELHLPDLWATRQHRDHTPANRWRLSTGRWPTFRTTAALRCRSRLSFKCAKNSNDLRRRLLTDALSRCWFLKTRFQIIAARDRHPSISSRQPTTPLRCTNIKIQPTLHIWALLFGAQIRLFTLPRWATGARPQGTDRPCTAHPLALRRAGTIDSPEPRSSRRAATTAARFGIARFPDSTTTIIRIVFSFTSRANRLSSDEKNWKQEAYFDKIVKQNNPIHMWRLSLDDFGRKKPYLLAFVYPNNDKIYFIAVEIYI